MEIFRISAARYAYKLTASGAANRWNQKGEFVIYAGSSRSLSTLELVVHRNAIHPSTTYLMMTLSVPDDDDLVQTVKTKQLPKNWRKLEAYASLQTIGSQWIQNQSSLLLKVPSVIIPQEYNYIINTQHPDFIKKVKLVRTESFFWDDRLL